MVRWGIIGCGDVCEFKSGPGFYKAESSSLVAVMRRDIDKAKDFANRHGIATYYADAFDIINDPQVDAVYVATPPDTHMQYAIAAMAAGKPVYVEKPMALNYGECLEMTAASEKYGQKLFVAYYRRALPYFLKVKELVDSGAVGKPIAVETSYLRPAFVTDKDPEQHTWRIKREIGGEGYFYDLAPHTIDILSYILGPIVSATGKPTNVAGYYNVPDTVTANFIFQNGISGTGLWSFVSSDDSTRDITTIYGSTGEVSFSTFSFDPIVLKKSGKQTNLTAEQPMHIQQPLIQTIVDELHGKGSCPSTGITAKDTSLIMDMIFGKI